VSVSGLRGRGGACLLFVVDWFNVEDLLRAMQSMWPISGYDLRQSRHVAYHVVAEDMVKSA